MKKDVYQTIEGPAEGIYREKGSKFLAFAYPVSGEEDIRKRIEELRKQFHDARHHCYAWRLGADMDSYRVNDDGEPSGSAGQPIFGQIRSRNLTQVLVVVVRYFGGTLLGVGGLIHAYRSAAEEALENARIIQMKVEVELELDFGYAEMSSVMRTIREFALNIKEQQFGTGCFMILSVWKRRVNEVTTRLKALEGCTVRSREDKKL
jgi:uncharacterized YigZ family protein